MTKESERMKVGMDSESQLDLEEHLTSYEDCLHGVLRNGLSYYVMKSDCPKGICELRLAVKVGSVYEEGPEEAGLAHLVEHLVFRCGRAGQRSYETVLFLESMGISFGTCMNGETRFEDTTFSLTVPLGNGASGDEELISKSLQVMSEWAFDTEFGEDDVAAEKAVICEEWGCHQTAERRGMASYLAALFATSKFASSQPMRDPASMKVLTQPPAKRFYEKWYCPSRMVVVAVGDFEHANHIVGFVKQHFERAHPVNNHKNPALGNLFHLADRVVIYEDDEEVETKLWVTCKRAPVPLVTINDFRNQLEEAVFQFCLVQRMKKYSLRTPTAVFRNPQCYTELFSSNVECTTFTATTSNDPTSPVTCLNTLISLVFEIHRVGFAEPEFLTATRCLEAAFEQDLLGSRAHAESATLAAGFVEHQVFSEPLMGTKRRAILGLKLLRTLTLKGISSRVDDFLDLKSWLVFVSRPKRGSEQEKENLWLALMNAQGPPSSAILLPALQFYSPQSPIFNVKPDDQDLVQKVHTFQETGTHEIVLAKGVRAFLRPSDSEGPSISFSAEAPGGFAHLASDSMVNGRVASVVVSGLTWFGLSPDFMIDLLAANNLEISVDILPFSRKVTGKCSPTSFGQALGLLRLLFTTSRDKDPRDIRAQIKRLEEVTSQQRRDPRFLFHQAVVQANSSHSSLICPLSQEDLRMADPSEVAAFFGDSFCDPAQFTFVFSGDFDMKEAAPLLSTYLGGIEPPFRGHARNQSPLPKISFPPNVVEKHLKMPMATPIHMAEISYPFDLQGGPLQRRIEKYRFTLLCDILRAKLTESLRFQLGSVYGVAVYCSEVPSTPETSTGVVSISFSCTSEEKSLSEVLDQVEQVISQLRHTLLTQEALDVAVAHQVRKFEAERMTNGFWIDIIRLVISEAQPYQEIFQNPQQRVLNCILEEIQSQTPETVRELFLKGFPLGGRKTLVTSAPTCNVPLDSEQVQCGPGLAVL